MRPGLIFKAQAATEIRRLFAGPFLPRALLRPGLIPIVPDIPRLRFQAQPSEPGWLDMALAVPLLDSTRARTELGWEATPHRDRCSDLETGICDPPAFASS